MHLQTTYQDFFFENSKNKKALISMQEALRPYKYIYCVSDDAIFNQFRQYRNPEEFLLQRSVRQYYPQVNCFRNIAKIWTGMIIFSNSRHENP